MKAYYHLPGLFEFYELYKEFLPLYRKHREYFYDWCDIGSIYGAPADCIWGGGRVGFGEHDPKEVLKLMQEYGISARLTFSNSLLTKEHLSDKKCNELCRIFDIGRDNERSRGFGNGIIIYSDILLDYIKENYTDFYFISSTTKVLTDFCEFEKELNRKDFRYVVPPEIEAIPEAKEAFLASMEEDAKRYLDLAHKLEEGHTARLMAEGMPEKQARAKASKQANEDARFVLPNACETKMVVTMNARSLQNFFHLRCCSRAQWEIRELAEKMFELVYPVAPHIFAKSGPACVSGPCPEGKMCCGKTAEVRAKYASIKEAAGV